MKARAHARCFAADAEDAAMPIDAVADTLMLLLLPMLSHAACYATLLRSHAAAEFMPLISCLTLRALARLIHAATYAGLILLFFALFAAMLLLLYRWREVCCCFSLAFAAMLLP